MQSVYNKSHYVENNLLALHDHIIETIVNRSSPVLSVSLIFLLLLIQLSIDHSVDVSSSYFFLIVSLYTSPQVEVNT
jgi:hypothetical protein